MDFFDILGLAIGLYIIYILLRGIIGIIICLKDKKYAEAGGRSLFVGIAIIGFSLGIYYGHYHYLFVDPFRNLYNFITSL